MFGAGFGQLGDAYVTTMELAGLDGYTSGLRSGARAWRELEDNQRRAANVPAMRGGGIDTSGIANAVGVGLSAGVTGPLLGLLGRSGQLGMAAVESENLVKVTFGSMTDSINKWSNNASSRLGFNAYEMRRQAGVAKQLFSGAGFDDSAANNMSKSLIEAKNDVVSFFNVADGEAMNNLQSGLSGETEPLRKYGIFITENTIKQYAWKNGIVAAGKELNEQQKIAARYGFIMNSLKTRNVIGDAERTKDSPSNRLRRQQNEVQEQMTKLGMSLMPLTSQLLDLTGQVIPPITKMVDAFSKLRPEAQKAFLAIAIGTGPVIIATTKLFELVKAVRGATMAKKALELATVKDTVAERIKSRVASDEGRAFENNAKSAVKNAAAKNLLKQAGGVALTEGGKYALGAGAGALVAGGAKQLAGGGSMALPAPKQPLAIGSGVRDGLRDDFVDASRTINAAKNTANWRHFFPVMKQVFKPTFDELKNLSFGQRASGAAQYLSRGTALEGLVSKLTTGAANTSIKNMPIARSLSGWYASMGGTSKFVDMAGRAAPWAARGAAVAGAGLAGYDASKDYQRAGYSRGDSNMIGTAIAVAGSGLLIASMIPAVLAAIPVLALAAPALLVGSLGRMATNKIYGEPFEAQNRGEFYDANGKRTDESIKVAGNYRVKLGNRVSATSAEYGKEVSSRMALADDLQRRANEIERRNVSGGTKNWRRLINIFKTGGDVGLADKMAEDDVREWWGYSQEAESIRKTANNQRKFARQASVQQLKTAAEEESRAFLQSILEKDKDERLAKRRADYAKQGRDYDAEMRDAGLITNAKPGAGEVGSLGYAITLAKFGFDVPKEQQALVDKNTRRDNTGLYDASKYERETGGQFVNYKGSNADMRDGSKQITIKLPPSANSNQIQEAIHVAMSPGNMTGY